MDNDLKAYYLQQLGVTQWLCRPKKEARCSLAKLEAIVASCTQCPLHQTRHKTVFARGNPSARLMIIGEAPGFHEDQQGLPFVGKAGQLLDQMLASIGLSNQDVYIANVLKCRPPNNRDPQDFEIEQCSSYLAEQIQLIEPKLIFAVGRFAAQFLLQRQESLTKLRSTIHHYGNTPVIVSYHPAYLLRNPAHKKQAYQDLLRVNEAFKLD